MPGGKTMLFEGRKVSDVGSSNPIVARLAIQTNQLLQAFPLAEENKQAIFAIYGVKVQERGTMSINSTTQTRTNPH